MSRSFHVRGAWPGEVRFRSGWAMAHARPWNDDLPDATLRLDRGGATMISAATGWLIEQGAPTVISPPLHPGAAKIWEDAAFEPFRTLWLMERDLSFPFERPQGTVRPGRRNEWERATEIDRAAFDTTWRVGRLGLSDALAATPRSRFLVAEADGDVAGFAIVGVAGGGSYLQRIAVHPDFQGRGLGSDLVLAGLAWAKERGAHTMILNTQPANDAAAMLYKRHRFETLPDSLQLFRHRP